MDVRSAKDHVTPLWYAAGRGQDEMVRFLLEKGADPNAGRWITDPGWEMNTPLDRAAALGHASTVASTAQVGTV